MKRFLYSVILILFIITSSALLSEEQSGLHGSQTGAPAARTGSPADMYSCTYCHTGTATSQTGLITSNIPVTGYIPGQTYSVTATISDATSVKFGFEISPQRTNGALTGTMILTETTRTKFVFGTGNKYITHQTAGTSAPGHTATWTFNWTAPAAGTGSFTFYGAFNISNSNGFASGDRVVLSTLPITEDITAGMETLANGGSFTAYPNPVSDKLVVTLQNQKQNTSVQLCDITGSIVKSIAVGELFNELNLSDLRSGVYFLHLTSGDAQFTKRIVKL
jgi:hypothetical protein